jgi:hypothetical protein
MSQFIVPGVAFAIASSPVTFKTTRKVFGSWVSTFEGVATPAGLFLHTLFFLFILYLVGMFMPRKSGFDFSKIGAAVSRAVQPRGGGKSEDRAMMGSKMGGERAAMMGSKMGGERAAM